MSEPDVQRDLGRLEGQVEALEKNFDDLREEMREGFRSLNEKMEPVATLATQVKAGWKTLAGIGVVASAVSAFVTSIIFRWKGGGP